MHAWSCQPIEQHISPARTLRINSIMRGVQVANQSRRAVFGAGSKAMIFGPIQRPWLKLLSPLELSQMVSRIPCVLRFSRAHA
jgi:hypothetical protein